MTDGYATEALPNGADPSTQQDLLTLSQACKELGCGWGTGKALVDSGELVAHKAGRSIVVTREALNMIQARLDGTVSVDDLAAMAGVNRKTVGGRVFRGEIEGCWKFGRVWRIPRDVARRFAEGVKSGEIQICERPGRSRSVPAGSDGAPEWAVVSQVAAWLLIGRADTIPKAENGDAVHYVREISGAVDAAREIVAEAKRQCPIPPEPADPEC